MNLTVPVGEVYILVLSALTDKQTNYMKYEQLLHKDDQNRAVTICDINYYYILRNSLRPSLPSAAYNMPVFTQEMEPGHLPPFHTQLQRVVVLGACWVL